MGKIVDISHHQGTIDFSKFSKEVDLAIVRVQYGSTVEDRTHKRNQSELKKYGVPFGTYAYGRFVSVKDAVVEAKDAIARTDKSAKFIVLDVEKDTIDSCGTKNLAEASQAFIDTLSKAGFKTGFYVSHEIYKKYNLDKVKADFLWLPRYGADNGTKSKKPDYPCDLWQYTQKGKVAGVSGYVDLNDVNGSKPLSWFVGGLVPKKESSVVASPASSSKEKAIGEAVIKVDSLNIRSSASLDSKVVGTALKNQKFPVYEKKDYFLRINKGKWISNKDGKYATYKSNSSSGSSSKPSSSTTYKVVKGDTLWDLSKKFKTTVGAIKSLNGLKSDTILVGQTLKIPGTSKTSNSQAKYHTVVKGDVVSKLAVKYGSTIDQIKAWNKLDKNYTIYVGQKLRVK